MSGHSEAPPGGWVDQQGKYDCWWACMSSLTRIPLARFYDTCGDPSPENDDDKLVAKTVQLLDQEGWDLHYFWHRHGAIPKGWSIACGPGPRGLQHSCLAYDGEIVHDPHPSRAGLNTIEDYEVLLPFFRGHGAVGHGVTSASAP